MLHCTLLTQRYPNGLRNMNTTERTVGSIDKDWSAIIGAYIHEYACRNISTRIFLGVYRLYIIHTYQCIYGCGCAHMRHLSFGKSIKILGSQRSTLLLSFQKVTAIYVNVNCNSYPWQTFVARKKSIKFIAHPSWFSRFFDMNDWKLVNRQAHVDAI